MSAHDSRRSKFGAALIALFVQARLDGDWRMEHEARAELRTRFGVILEFASQLQKEKVRHGTDAREQT